MQHNSWEELREAVNSLCTQHRGLKSHLAKHLKIQPIQVTNYLAGIGEPSFTRGRQIEKWLFHRIAEINQNEPVCYDGRRNLDTELQTMKAEQNARTDKIGWAIKAGIVS